MLYSAEVIKTLSGQLKETGWGLPTSTLGDKALCIMYSSYIERLFLLIGFLSKWGLISVYNVHWLYPFSCCILSCLYWVFNSVTLLCLVVFFFMFPLILCLADIQHLRSGIKELYKKKGIITMINSQGTEKYLTFGFALFVWEMSFRLSDKF